MTTKWRLVACTLVGAAAYVSPERAAAIELLTSGNFEFTPGVAPPEVPSWTLTEFRATNPSAVADTASLVSFADAGGEVDGQFGLWLKGFAGNPTDGLATAILSQSVPAVPGETYQFSGEAEFQANYSGGVTTLDPSSPFGAIPSPTRTEFELAFLDAGGAVIGSPVVRDLSTEVFNGFGYTAVSPISGVAPAGTASVRVRAQGIDMANNELNPQSAFVDNFSLTTLSNPSTELLANPQLTEAPEVPPTAEEVLAEYFEFIESPESANSLSIAGFANNPATGGVNGVWIRPFVADAESAVVQQTVAGSAGTEYTFTASSRWEVNFYQAEGGENEMLLELAFLDSEGAVIDSSTLDLRAAGQVADNAWYTHSVSATAPVGTVDVRVAGITNNITPNPATGTTVSAFWDDFSLMAAVAGLPGDYNGDNVVDAADYTVWRDGNSPDDTQAGYDLWAANYGATAAPSAAASIPEPTACVLVLGGLAAVAGCRRLV